MQPQVQVAWGTPLASYYQLARLRCHYYAGSQLPPIVRYACLFAFHLHYPISVQIPKITSSVQWTSYYLNSLGDVQPCPRGALFQLKRGLSVWGNPTLKR